jgi:hypothetical protein
MQIRGVSVRDDCRPRRPTLWPRALGPSAPGRRTVINLGVRVANGTCRSDSLLRGDASRDHQHCASEGVSHHARFVAVG